MRTTTPTAEVSHGLSRVRLTASARLALFVGLGAFSPIAISSACDAVLIPAKSRMTSNLKLAIDTTTVHAEGSGNSSSSSQEFSAPMPVEGGPPIEVGYKSGNASAGYKYLRDYNRHKSNRDESLQSVISALTSDQIAEWGKCMQNNNAFSIFIEPDSITNTSAVLKVSNFLAAPASSGLLRLYVQNGTIDGSTQVSKNISGTGVFPFVISRSSAGKLIVTAEFSGHSPTVSFSTGDRPLTTPKITYRVNGNLQSARVVDDIKFTPNFDVSAGVQFATNNWLLKIEQLIDGRVCASRTVSMNDQGDMMDSTPQWSMNRMKAGCQHRGGAVASSIQCFVDPVWPASCQ